MAHIRIWLTSSVSWAFAKNRCVSQPAQSKGNRRHTRFVKEPGCIYNQPPVVGSRSSKKTGETDDCYKPVIDNNKKRPDIHGFRRSYWFVENFLDFGGQH